jgi:hypothetical protein
MRTRWILCSVLALGFILSQGATIGFSQETSNSAAKPEPPEAVKPVEAYRLDFSVNEIEDGKRINSRQYSMNLNVNDGNEIKIGTRVPVEAKQGEFEYLDVGTMIYGRLSERSERAEMSNFAVPEQAQGHDSHPVLRQLRINASTLALLGKPMVVGSVDDPNSKRQFQLEVTATKLR